MKAMQMNFDPPFDLQLCIIVELRSHMAIYDLKSVFFSHSRSIILLNNDVAAASVSHYGESSRSFSVFISASRYLSENVQAFGQETKVFGQTESFCCFNALDLLTFSDFSNSDEISALVLLCRLNCVVLIGV